MATKGTKDAGKAPKEASKSKDGKKDETKMDVVVAAKKPAPKKEAAKKKAMTAAKATKKGTQSRRIVGVRTSVKFRRPKTLKLRRDPKYDRKSTIRRNKMDKFTVIKHPLCTESAMKQIEDNNTLTFIVDIRANKRQIRSAIKQLYNIEVIRVNTLIRPDGQKKAYARLSPDHEALESANSIGII